MRRSYFRRPPQDTCTARAVDDSGDLGELLY